MHDEFGSPLAESCDSPISKAETCTESCAGLLRIQNRSLRSDEVRRIRRKSYLLYLAGLLSGVLWFIIFIVVLLLIITLEPRSVPATEINAAIILAICSLTVPIILLGNDLTRRASYLRTVAKARQVRCFRGQLHAADFTDPSIRALSAARLLEAITPESEVLLELLPKTDVLYSLNGVPVRKHIQLHVTLATNAPSNPTVLDAPASWFQEPLEPRLERRKLSPAEIEELLSYKVGKSKAIFRTLWHGLISAMISASILDHTHIAPDVGIEASIIMGIIMMGASGYRTFKRNRAICMDAGLGWTIISSPSDAPQPSVVEVLLVSHLVWTIGGKPAGWRKASGR